MNSIVNSIVNSKTLIELAREAGWEYADDDRGFEPLWHFAELVRADEREACAKVCEDSVEYAGDELARQIRARGNT